jgi:hypothetical protein
MMRTASRLFIVALLLMAVVSLVLQGGSLPHVHAATQAGLFNEEHDLTLLAGLATHVVLGDATPPLTLDAASSDIAPSVPERPALRLARSADSRAPPSR